ncbi:MAG: RagB/SusD family nutrient uptake outer membrane protein [Imperialibacter sp.]|uniref:RagB/SusD family nutrient uptake outer membrane protein n=1 Tax=Imperialibacter sp. TaxID=2038411 RepID=UPI003A8587D4
MKKTIAIFTVLILSLSSCNDFLELEPEYVVSETGFYKTAKDFDTGLIGAYSGLQDLHSLSLLYITELTTDNAEIQWSSPTTAESECDEMNMTLANSFVGEVWSDSFTAISRANTILSKLDGVDISEALKSQYRGEALFLRAYNYFNLVRLFGDLPLITVSFKSPKEIADFDMGRKPASEIYNLIVSDLTASAGFLKDVSGLSKSRASEGAASTLLGKVYLTMGEHQLAASVLEDVMGMGYTLEDDYAALFSPGNDELGESIFEVKYMSGNVGEGNRFSSVFFPALFNLGMFPGNMQGNGRINPTSDVASAYETGDARRPVSIADSVRLLDGTYGDYLAGLKFVDFTTGILGDGGVNYTSLRYADVLLMYAEALNELSRTDDAHEYLNMVRERADLDALAGLSKADFSLALERERRVEFFNEGHRWFDLLRTGRLQTVMNAHFAAKGQSFTVENYELLMPIPQRELDIDVNLAQNDGY